MEFSPAAAAVRVVHEAPPEPGLPVIPFRAFPPVFEQVGAINGILIKRVGEPAGELVEAHTGRVPTAVQLRFFGRVRGGVPLFFSAWRFRLTRAAVPTVFFAA